MGAYHLISGGCGFLGRHVAIALAEAGHSVVVADRQPRDPLVPSRLRDAISYRPLNLLGTNWDPLVENAEVIYHYAWTSLPANANSNPMGDLDVNVMATLSLLEALRRRGGGRLVFPSSGGTVYGKLQQVPVAEHAPLRPITAYGASKATAEIYLGLYRELYGIDSRIARIANPYGRGQNIRRGQGAVTRFLQNALFDESISIWGDGEVVRDYLYIDDVTRALLALASQDDLASEYIFNIGSGHGCSLNQIVSAIELLLGRKLLVRYEPARSFDVPVSVLDISRARQVLHWQPTVDLASGLAATAAHLSLSAQSSTALAARVGLG